MWEKIKSLHIKLKTVVYSAILVALLAGVTPVLAEYIGPNRTITRTVGDCKVVLASCTYVAAKKTWKYKNGSSWSCSNESKPWLAYPSKSVGCNQLNKGYTYWRRVDNSHEEIITYPSATIESSLQDCSLHNGWCTDADLFLSADEPVAGYEIIAIEGTLNGQNFACADSECSVPVIQGENALTYWALSSWGDSSTMGSMTVQVDSELPVISGAFSGITGSNGWYFGPVSFTGSAADTTSGLASFTCTVDGVSLSSCDSVSFNDEGAHTLVLTALDHAGNSSLVAQDVSIDTQPPTLNSSLQGILGSNSWYNDAKLHASATDPVPGSGLSLLEYSIDSASWDVYPSTGVLDLPEGKHSVDVRVTDTAGHSVSSSKSFWLDSVAPGVILDPQGTLGSNDWYVSSLNLTASVNDDTSGVESFEYAHNGSAWTAYTAPLVLTDGLHKISFWAQDKAGLVTQVDRVFQVDTIQPQIAGSISGTPGTNGWYVSNVTLSASASDPLPGSGIDAFTYALNGGPETPYINALTFPDGIHAIRLNVQDKAGLTYFTEQSVKVDTIRPSLIIETSLPNWVKEKVNLTGTSDDTGSGLSKVEISSNGGQTWQTASGTTAWNYEWDTTKDSNGSHNVIVRTVDQAGLTTEQTIATAVDNQSPTIILPASWLQWQTVTLDIWDSESGLSEARIEISDPTGRWQKRTITLDSAQFPLSFKWDRRFGDNTIAPNGNYDVTVTAIDQLGNLSQQSAAVRILIDILPAGPTATPQPYYRMIPTPVVSLTPAPTSLPAVTSTPVVSVFGEIQPTLRVTSTPEVSPTPRATPTQTGILEWLESVLIPDTNSKEETTKLEVSGLQSASTASPGTDSNILWGAAAAAMVGAVTSFALEERRKREAVARTPEPQEDPEELLQARRSKSRAKKMKKLEAKSAQEKAWEQARQEAEFNEKYGQAIGWAVMRQKANEATLPEPDFATKGTEAKIDRYESPDSANQKKTETAKTAEQTQRAEQLQDRVESYQTIRKQTAAASVAVAAEESNWWEKTKSFVSDNIVAPFDQYIYTPIIQPAIDKRNEVLASTASWLNKNVYQPYIEPKLNNGVDKLKDDISWINETIIQPWVIPFFKEVGGVISDAVSLVNTYVIEPYVAPFIAKSVEFALKDFAQFNETIFRPYILPALESFNENFYQPYLAPIVDAVATGIGIGVNVVNEHIYQPIFAPVVNDINKYIVKSYVDPALEWWDKTWDEYGEWVHNGLDAVGFIPGLGDIMDGVNGLIYLAEGRYLEASISAVAMIPVLGDLAKGGKLALKVTAEIVEEGAEKIVKEIVEEGAEQTAKQLAENAAQKAIAQTTEELAEKTAKDTLQNAAGKITNETAQEMAESVSQKVATNAAEELSQKLAKEAPENAASKIAHNAVENAPHKAIAESAANATENDVQKISDNILEKTAKDPGEAITSAVTEKASKEAKQKLVEQAIEKVDDKTAELVRSVADRLGDEVASINKAVALVQKYGDNAVKALQAIKPDAAAKVLRTVNENLLDDVVQQGPDAFAAFSGWTEKELLEHGKDLAARATKDAEVLNDVKTLVSKGPIDPKNLTEEQKLLIEKIAANSTFNIDGSKVVVGKWVGLDGGFLQRAKGLGALHYSPHPDLWELFGKLDNQNEVAWLINQKVIQNGVAKRLPFEYTLDDVPDKVLDNEHDAIEAIFFENPSDDDILRLLKSDYIPVRVRELQEVRQAGYKLDFDNSIQSYILSPL